MMNDFLLQYVKNPKQISLFLGLIFISFVYTFFYFFQKEKSEEGNSVVQISDMIPAHFVMVPVELENHETISDLIPSHGIVDLYQTVPGSSIPHRTAQAVQMIRTSSDQFNILIPEDRVAPFVQSQTLFYAVVQNSSKKDTQIYPLPVRRKRSIQFKEELE